MVGWKGRAWIKLKLDTVHCSAPPYQGESNGSVEPEQKWCIWGVGGLSEKVPSGNGVEEEAFWQHGAKKDFRGQTTTYKPLRGWNKFTENQHIKSWDKKVFVTMTDGISMIPIQE